MGGKVQPPDQWDVMRRREFITLLGGATSAWPLMARAQDAARPLIGYLSARSREDTSHLIEAFRGGLAENGYVEGSSVSIEYRFALGQYDKLAEMARDFVHRRVAVIASTGGENAAFAAKTSTSSIPIVFVVGGDPVKQGLAASYNRPGGNATGIVLFAQQLEPKRLGLMRELVPQVSTIGFLLNPSFSPAQRQLLEIEEAARHLNLAIHVLRADTDREIDAAFETVTQQRIPALSVAASPFFDTRRDKLVALATRNAVPTIFHFREFVEAGGLMSYGINFSEAYRQAGVYTGRVLKGARPGDLPIMQATKFELLINMKTARALGLKVPDNLLSIADRVIE
jgi:putative ABC transport system substrate-binding protein